MIEQSNVAFHPYILPSSSPKSLLSAASLKKSMNNLGFIKNKSVMRPYFSNDKDKNISSFE